MIDKQNQLFTYPNQITPIERSGLNALGIELCTIGAAAVLDKPCVSSALNPRMLPADEIVIDLDVTAVVTSDSYGLR